MRSFDSYIFDAKLAHDIEVDNLTLAVTVLANHADFMKAADLGLSDPEHYEHLQKLGELKRLAMLYADKSTLGLGSLSVEDLIDKLREGLVLA